VQALFGLHGIGRIAVRRYRELEGNGDSTRLRARDQRKVLLLLLVRSQVSVYHFKPQITDTNPSQNLQLQGTMK
jgi:hypothetical protein